MASAQDHSPRLLLAITAVVCAAGGGVWWLLQTPEDHVRSAIQAGASAASRRDTPGVMDVVDDAFRGPRGVNFKTASDAVRYALEAHYLGGVEVEVSPEDFPVQCSHQDKRAVARFKVKARGRPQRDGAWQDILEAWKLGDVWEVTLSQRDGHWRITSLQTVP